jgi:hypothetical protein
MKAWQLLCIAGLLLALGVAGDVAIQRTTSDDSLHVDSVDVAHDQVTFSSNQSFADRFLETARKQHLALIAGAVAAWGPLVAAWRSRKTRSEA